MEMLGPLLGIVVPLIAVSTITYRLRRPRFASPALINSGPPMRMSSGDTLASATDLAEAYNRHKRIHGGSSGRWASAAELLASGQRVPGVLRSYAATGNTLRSLGRPATAAPALLDAPQYIMEVELRFPNLPPVTGRNVQPIPSDAVPHLAIGLEIVCAIDPSDPAHRFVVDWASSAE